METTLLVYRIAKCEYINDLSGTGAALYGGRWNHKGSYVLYTGSSSSLALLESIVHISSVIHLKLCLVCLQLPLNSIKEVLESDLPSGWDKNPSPFDLKSIGDAFIKENQFLALKVPSAIMPLESNYLINPAHKDFTLIQTKFVRSVHVDELLIKK